MAFGGDPDAGGLMNGGEKLAGRRVRMVGAVKKAPRVWRLGEKNWTWKINSSTDRLQYATFTRSILIKPADVASLICTGVIN